MLELDHLSKSYGAVRALDGLSFEVRPGEIFGFVGSNGAGKTTAMRIMLGVLAADRGTVRWQGAELDLHTRRRVSKDWSVALRLNNVSDKAYETARGYNQAGRSAFLTLNWKPGQ